MWKNVGFWVTGAAFDYLPRDLRNILAQFLTGNVFRVRTIWIIPSIHHRGGKTASLKQRAFDFVPKVFYQSSTTSKAASSMPVEVTEKWQTWSDDHTVLVQKEILTTPLQVILTCIASVPLKKKKRMFVLNAICQPGSRGLTSEVSK